MSAQKPPARGSSNKSSPAPLIPMTVLASVPERLEILADAIDGCLKDYKRSKTATELDEVPVDSHVNVIGSFEDVKGNVSRAVDSFSALRTHVFSAGEQTAFTSAEEALALINTIDAASGDLYLRSGILSLCQQPKTIKAIKEALYDCAAQIRSAIDPFGL